MTTNSIDIDLYQIKHLLAYRRLGMENEQMTMEVFTRKLPSNRTFLVVAGVDRVIDYLQKFSFTKDDISVLESAMYHELTLTEEDKNYLLSVDLKKSLSVRAMRDGEIAFTNQPIMSITGPKGLVQYIEKHICSIINHDVRIASKAARIVIAAKDKPVFEYGGRRAHEECTADTAAAAYIAGFAGTSSVAGYQKYDIPVSGTMGHVWILSHAKSGLTNTQIEYNAFYNWAKIYPEGSTYLIDTYDVLTGVDNAIRATKDAKAVLSGVRLDSGNLIEQSVVVRRALNNAGLFNTKIIATNDLNEYKINDIVNHLDSKIDSFGVGTEVVATPDAPTANFVYKPVSMVDYKGNLINICKFSAGGKATLPGAKQVYRFCRPIDNVYTHDVVDLDDDKTTNDNYMTQLLVDIDLNNYKQNIVNSRNYCRENLNKLPLYIKVISEDNFSENSDKNYPVIISDRIKDLQKSLYKR